MGPAPCSSKSRHTFAQEQSNEYRDDPQRGLTQLVQRVQKRLHTGDCVSGGSVRPLLFYFLLLDSQSDLDQLQHRCHNPGELGVRHAGV